MNNQRDQSRRGQFGRTRNTQADSSRDFENRDTSRMLNYNTEFIPKSSNSWSDADQMRQQVESDGRNYQQSRNSRNKKRATEWKKKNQKKEEPSGPKINGKTTFKYLSDAMV